MLLPVTIVTACKARLGLLREALPTWLALPVEKIIVVDASCPEGTGAYANSFGDPRVEVVQIEMRGAFRHSMARNAGLRRAKTPWVALIDCDIQLAPPMEAVFSSLQPGHFYRSDRPTDGLTGQVIAENDILQKMGGYDEVYRDYGDEDIDLFRRLKFHQIKPAQFSHLLLRHVGHEDELRTAGQSISDKELSLSLNTAYGLAKMDAMRIMCHELTAEFRVKLYETVREKARLATSTGQTQRIELEMPESETSRLRFMRTLVIRIAPTSAQEKSVPSVPLSWFGGQSGQIGKKP